MRKCNKRLYIAITLCIHLSLIKTLSCLPSLQYNELVDKVTSSETKVSEMETTVEDLQWDIEKLRNREQKLNKHLAEAMEQVCLVLRACSVLTVHES